MALLEAVVDELENQAVPLAMIRMKTPFDVEAQFGVRLTPLGGRRSGLNTEAHMLPCSTWNGLGSGSFVNTPAATSPELRRGKRLR